MISAIADDYESIEAIAKTINEGEADISVESWPARRAVPVSRPEAISAVQELTREGYAQTYVLDTKEPYAQAIEFREDKADDLCFYLTPKGQRCDVAPMGSVQRTILATNS